MSAELITKTDWQKLVNSIKPVVSEKVTALLQQKTSVHALDSMASSVEHDGFRIDVTVQGQGTITLTVADTPIDIEVKLFAEKQEGNWPVYHSGQDSSINTGTINDTDQIERAVKEHVDQAGERAVMALTRSLGRKEKQVVIHAIQDELNHLQQDKVDGGVLDPPLSEFLAQTTSAENIDPFGAWHIRFVAKTLQKIDQQLREDGSINGASVNPSVPDRNEHFDWLRSELGRYSYFAYYFDGPEGVVQKANQHETEHDAQTELQRAIKWELAQISQQVCTLLKNNLDRYYEYLDRETDQIDRVEQ